MSRADLAGLIVLTTAYFLGASQAPTLAQARAYALLALLLAILAGATWLLLAPGIAQLQRLIRYGLRYRDALKRRRWVLLSDAKALAVKLRGQLRQADTELRMAVRELDTRERDLAEKDAELNRQYAWRRGRRRGVARRLRRR